jgi:hypothetical protein
MTTSQCSLTAASGTCRATQSLALDSIRTVVPSERPEENPSLMDYLVALT